MIKGKIIIWKKGMKPIQCPPPPFSFHSSHFHSFSLATHFPFGHLLPSKMSADEKEYVPDLAKVNEDSVPPKEKEIKHTHAGRPDLDYDETPVGPADGYVPAGSDGKGNNGK